MRRITGVSLLSLVLACSAYAGDIPNGVTGDIPNGSPAQSTTVSTTQEPQTSVDPITEIVLTLLSGVLSIF